MAVAEQLEWEGRLGKPAAAAGFLAAAFTLAGVVYQTSAIKAKPKNQAELLVSMHAQPSQYLVGAIVLAIGTAMVAPVLWYLVAVTRARRPQIPRLTRPLAIAAPLVGAVVQVIGQIHENSVAKQFVTTGTTSGAAAEKRANTLATHSAAAIGALGLAAGLAVAFAFVLGCLFAMRAGVLPRYMGYVGIAIGALGFLPILPYVSVILEIVWLPAIGLLFLNRWPGGRGPAWETGEPIPWPTQANRRALLQGRKVESGPDRAGDAATRAASAGPERIGRGGTATAAAPGSGNGASEAAVHPRSKKRKRKRRG